ncbi:phage tail protein I [Persicimonas caeni]|uniref:Phage tail protein I n=1 Tax=Persicimonas caeni TaxID=2292766 RepID=A0A4Y6PWX7_PERCE|nr:phage tail protein I [Persicimonas caeni]QDG52265.1 phage tail protein I [Persicimonas caeni]QED33487.1 phage tail protein I [Persicimonas caeni]
MTRVLRPFDFVLADQPGWRIGEQAGVEADAELRLAVSDASPEPDDATAAPEEPPGVATWRGHLFVCDPLGDVWWWSPSRRTFEKLALPTPGCAIELRRVIVLVAPGTADEQHTSVRRDDEGSWGIAEPVDWLRLADEALVVTAAPGTEVELHPTGVAEPVALAVEPNGRARVEFAQLEGDPGWPGGITDLAVRDDGTLLAANADKVGYVRLPELTLRRLVERPADDAWLPDVSDKLAVEAGRLLIGVDGVGPGCCEETWIETGIAIDTAGHVTLPDGQTAFVTRPPAPVSYTRSGWVLFEMFDSGREDNRWHRVVIDAAVPEGAALQVFAASTNLERAPLSAQNVDDAALRPPSYRESKAGAREWMIMCPPGRYLQLGVRLRGSGASTARVRAIYLYAHRQTAVEFLPRVYRSEPARRDVLERLQGLFDTVFAELEQQAIDFPRWLDVDAAPARVLPWLASWFDLRLLAQWDDATRRAFLREVADLHRRRGTVGGLRRIVQLHCGLARPPQIIEHFRGRLHDKLRRWLDSPEVDAAHHFSVYVPAAAVATDEKRLTLRRLISQHAPAHTHFDIVGVEPGVRLAAPGVRASALGVDALLGPRGDWRLPADDEPVDRSVLDRTTITSQLDAADRRRLGQSHLNQSHLNQTQTRFRARPCDDGGADTHRGSHT